MDKKVYFDNGATSFPKAPGVAEAMSNYLLNNGASVSRGAYKDAMDASRIVYDTRELLAELFHFDHADHVIFTKNVTESINQILKGYLTSEDHVLVSSLEHNAVMRPLNSIGCKVDKIPCDGDGNMMISTIEDLIRPETKAIVMLHASNVFGTVNDIKAVGDIAKENKITFVLDAAQTAGVIDIDMEACHIDALCFTGHKALLGPTGIGGFLIKPHLVDQVKPLIEGGTGSASELEVQPSHMPDKYESGTPNVVGIYGLHAALKYIIDQGLDVIHKKEMACVQYFMDHFHHEKAKIVGRKDIINRTAVLSLDFDHVDHAVVSFYLEKDYRISTRVGMHCAPSAHQAMGTFPSGTLRVSFSYFTSFEDIDYLIKALNTTIDKA